MLHVLKVAEDEAVVWERWLQCVRDVPIHGLGYPLFIWRSKDRGGQTSSHCLVSPPSLVNSQEHPFLALRVWKEENLWEGSC